MRHLILDNWRRHCPQSWNPHLALYTQMIIPFIDIWPVKICQTSKLCLAETPCNETKLSSFHCVVFGFLSLFCAIVIRPQWNETLLFCFILRQKMPERPKRRGKNNQPRTGKNPTFQINNVSSSWNWYKIYESIEASDEDITIFWSGHFR